MSKENISLYEWNSTEKVGFVAILGGLVISSPAVALGGLGLMVFGHIGH